MNGIHEALCLILALCLQCTFAQPVQPDVRHLKERVEMRYVKIVTDSDFEADDDGNIVERVFVFIICIATMLFFLATLCYSIATKGKGKLLREEIPYRPRHFIAADRATGAVASGGA